MNLEALYFLSQVVAAIALIGSLIFVGLQVRQSSKQAEQANFLAHAESQRDMVQGPEYWHPLFTVPGLMDDFRFCMNRYDEADAKVKSRFHTFMFPLFLHVDSIHRMHERGLFDDDLYYRYLGAWDAMISTPGAASWWNDIKTLQNPSFEAGVAKAAEKLTEEGLQITDAFDFWPMYREEPGEFNDYMPSPNSSETRQKANHDGS